jgi:hypothetical protein
MLRVAKDIKGPKSVSQSASEKNMENHGILSKTQP